MRFSAEKKDWKAFKGHALIAGMFKGQKLSSDLSEINSILHNSLQTAIDSMEFDCEAGVMQSFPTYGHLPFKRLILVGLGDAAPANPESFRKASATAINACKVNGWNSAAFLLHETNCSVPFKEKVQAVSEGALLASYNPPDFRTAKTDKQKNQKIDSIELLCENGLTEAQNILAKAQIVCNSVFLVRDWVNFGSSYKTPVKMAGFISKEAKKNGIKCNVLDKKQLLKLGMGGILGVNAGSPHPPVLVKLEYKPSRFRKTIALVGKGITFDSGGLNLKPWEGMLTMKQDMAGAATVAAAILAASQLKLPVRVIGFMPFTENTPAGNAYKDLDILTTFNGKTIEVIHTDAEGRIVLADALGYAESHKPDFIIDLATLTGAQDVALGRYFIGAMANDFPLLKKVLDAGNKSMERCWELPLIPEWDELVKSDVADVRNISKNKGEAGTLIGGAFLKQFVEKTPWVHLDIASTAFFLDGDASRSYLPKGASGTGVRLLVELLKTWN